MAAHLDHVVPQLNYTPVKPTWDHSTLRDLDKLNSWDKGTYVFLTSSDDVETRPDWLGGEENIPEPYGFGPMSDETDPDSFLQDEENNHRESQEADCAVDDNSSRSKKSRSEGGNQAPIGGSAARSCAGGRSDAPAVLIVLDKGNGVVDAFWFYFYSYNLGNEVFGVRFGNHVGDWEHSLVRFHHGTPKAVFLSEHAFGEAYSYEAVEKMGQRVGLLLLFLSHYSLIN